MARGSLYLVIAMGIGGPSCLITASSDFPAPDAKGPFIVPVTPTTSILSPQVRQNRIDPVPIGAVLYSEDAAKPLQYLIFLDYGKLQQPSDQPKASIISKEFAPRSLSEPRPVNESVNLAGISGCHSLTLMATHNYRSFTPAGLDPDDAAVFTVGPDPHETTALITWWLDIPDVNDPDKHVTLDMCPGSAPAAPGNDGGP